MPFCLSQKKNVKVTQQAETVAEALIIDLL